MFHFVKILLISTLLTLFFVPVFVEAVDQRCFTEEECNAVRSDLILDEETSSGFYQGADSMEACGGEFGVDGQTKIGFCSATGPITTAITFGTTQNFKHLGDFIKFIYKYAVWVAGILVVFIIMQSGMQWIFSAGSPEKITAARKRISGAMMGLFLVIMSYFILNAINPYLVNLRLPQTWMINPQKLAPLYCDSFAGKVALAYGKNEEKLSDSKLKAKLAEADFSIDTQTQTECGNHYFVEKTGGQTCQSLRCDTGKVCLENDDKNYYCTPAVLAGTISGSLGLICSEDLSDGKIVDNLKLIAVFKDGDIEEIKERNGLRRYVFSKSLVGKIEELKKDKRGLVGFYLGAEINDEEGFGCELMGHGCDDWFAIGKTSANSYSCRLNLGKLGYSLLTGESPICKGEAGPSNCSCAAISKDKDMAKLASNKNFTNHLLTADELLAGYRCDIYITRVEFPDLDNGDSVGGCYSDAYILSPDEPTHCWKYQDRF